MDSPETTIAFEKFDAALTNATFDREVYDGEEEGDEDESLADKKQHLVESLRVLSNAANVLAAELNAE